jgi:hypothetical protein
VRPPSDERPFADSICHRCSHLRLVQSGRGSVFLMCQHPELPKYASQPIVACRGFTSR